MSKYKIVSLPGDGIGVDTTEAAMKVLDASNRESRTIQWNELKRLTTTLHHENDLSFRTMRNMIRAYKRSEMAA